MIYYSFESLQEILVEFSFTLPFKYIKMNTTCRMQLKFHFWCMFLLKHMIKGGAKIIRAPS